MLERTQWDLFWLPPNVRVVDRPSLLYVTSGEPDEYLNAVLRTRGPVITPLVEEASAAHAHVASRWTIPPSSRALGLEPLLAKHGYAPSHEHFGYSLACLDHRPREGKIVARMVSTLEELRAAIDVSSRAFDRPNGTSDERLALELASCTAPNARVRRFVAWDGDTPVASAGMTMHPALGFALLFAGGTIPEARGRGAYAALVDARVRTALEHGLARVGLYARVDSSAPLVEARGFTKHGPMTYWSRPLRT